MNKRAPVTISELLVVPAPQIMDIPSMILKLKNSGKYMSLQSWMEDYIIPPNTLPSNKTPTDCYFDLVEWERKNPIPRHAGSVLARISDSSPSLVSPTQVVTVCEKPVTYPVTAGFLEHNIVKVMASVTSTLVAYSVLTTDQGNSSIVFPKAGEVPIVDYCKIKSKLKVTDKSPTVTRDGLYDQMIVDPLIVMKIHTDVGEPLVNYVKHEELTKSYRKYIPGEFVIKTVQVPQLEEIPSTSDMVKAYKYSNLCEMARGTTKGRGSLTLGYGMFEAPRREVKLLNMIRDLRNMLTLANSSVICIEDPDIDMQIVQSLVQSKIYVHLPNSVNPIMGKKSPPGAYSHLNDVRSKQAITLLNMDAKLNKPDHTAAGPVYKTAQTKIMLETLKRRPRSFLFAYIDPSLVSNSFSTYPISAADTMRVIVAYKLSVNTFKLTKLIKRASQANTVRNWYPFYRLPYCRVDPMNDFVRWETQIYLPQSAQLRRVKNEFTLDEGTTGHLTTEIKFRDELPSDFQINFKQEDKLKFEVLPEYAPAIKFVSEVAPDNLFNLWHEILSNRLDNAPLRRIDVSLVVFDTINIYELFTYASYYTGKSIPELQDELGIDDSFARLDIGNNYVRPDVGAREPDPPIITPEVTPQAIDRLNVDDFANFSF
jgi:hypothetical protein